MPAAVVEEVIMTSGAQARASLLGLRYALSTTAEPTAHTHMTELGTAIRAVPTGTIMLYARRMDAPFSDCMSIMGLGIIAPTIRMAAVDFAEGAPVTVDKNAK